MGRVMTTRKAAIRREVRASRARRLREREAVQRAGAASHPRGPGASAAPGASGGPDRPGEPGSPVGTGGPGRPGDPDGMLASWRRVLGLLGLAPSGEPLDAPALFVPTAMEPDVRPVIDAHPLSLLPVLVTPLGVPLSGPAWAVHEGGSTALSQPDPRRPAQPTGELLGPEALGEAAVVLVAALAVDRSGTRLGQGGGWYDRALEHLHPGTPVVAAVFDEEVLPEGVLPREVHDHPVDAVITPTGALLLG